MLKREDGRKETPLSVAVASDSVNAIATIFKCSAINRLPVEFQSRNEFYNLVKESKAEKTMKWLETAQFRS